MSGSERIDGFYRAVRAVARFWLWFFFKAVTVRHPERVPRDGPVLLCINHPNNFIDSLVVGAAVRRKVHYLATAALFRNPLIARFLLTAGAIPVYRRQDDPDKMGKNAGAVDALTRHVQDAMEAEVVNVERIDDARLLQSIEGLYRDVLARAVMEARGVGPREVDLVRLSRSIVEAIGWFKAREPERVEAIWQRIRIYRALLAEYHLRDETVRARLERLPTRQRIVYSWDAVVGLPFFVYGAAVNLLPYLLPRWLARRMARKETDYATVRLLASTIAFPVFYGVEIWLVFRAAGGLAAALFALSLPLSGLVAYRYLAGAGRFRSRLRFALLTATHGAAARLVVAERDASAA